MGQDIQARPMILAIVIADPDQVESAWSVIAPWLEEAFLGDKSYTIDDVKKEILADDRQLFIAWVDREVYGFAITSVNDMPQQRVGFIYWCGGKQMDLWFEEGIAAIESFFRVNACSKYTVFGRKGWGKLITFDTELALLSKNL